MYKGVHMKIDDGVFPPEFMNEPRLYGGVDVDESEKRALMLPPKFGLLEEVNVTKCRVQLEEALNQLRWNGIYGSEEQIGDMNMYDIGTRSMDINNLKVTSLPFNPGVRMPGTLMHEEKVRIHGFKDDVMKVAWQMKSKGKEWENLSEEEKTGLESLKSWVRAGDVVCRVTDKSGRWACDTLNNYKEACMNELRDVEKTPEIDIREHDKGEREMNCNAAALLRMMGLEEGEGTQGERMRNTVQATGTGLAPFYGLRKDHKAEEGDTGKGPNVRPVRGASECATRRTSYLLC